MNTVIEIIIVYATVEMISEIRAIILGSIRIGANIGIMFLSLHRVS